MKKDNTANATVADGLKPYLIGEKLRSLRLRKSMGLVELGRHTKLSPAMLSKLERGKLFPTLPTLLRIAMVFSVGLDYFFTDERKRRVVAMIPKAERLRFPERPKEPDVSYFFESLDIVLFIEKGHGLFIVQWFDTPVGKGAVFIFHKNTVTGDSRGSFISVFEGLQKRDQ